MSARTVMHMRKVHARTEFQYSHEIESGNGDSNLHSHFFQMGGGAKSSFNTYYLHPKKQVVNTVCRLGPFFFLSVLCFSLMCIFFEGARLSPEKSQNCCEVKVVVVFSLRQQVLHCWMRVVVLFEVLWFAVPCWVRGVVLSCEMLQHDVLRHSIHCWGGSLC